MKEETHQMTTNDAPKTLTEFCGQPENAFGQYLAQKDAYLHALDEKAEMRISAALCQNMSWAV